jgi:kinesin family member 13
MLRKALPKIQEVGFIAKELKRDIQFSTKILYKYNEPGEIDIQEQKLKKNIQILVKNNEEGTEYVWDLEKFSNRYYIIKGLLDRYFESNKIVVKKIIFAKYIQFQQETPTKRRPILGPS